MVIIDASVAFKCFDASEENLDQAFSILKTHLLENNILVPDLFFYELANAWVTKSRLSLKEIEDHLKTLKEYKLNVQHPTYDLIQQAVNFSRKYKISFYDAIYAVLAQDNKCTLITADTKFTAQVNLPFAQKLSDYAL